MNGDLELYDQGTRKMIRETGGPVAELTRLNYLAENILKKLESVLQRFRVIFATICAPENRHKLIK